MIRINQLKLSSDHKPEELKKKILSSLRIKEGELLTFHIHKQSIDARKKPDIFYVYTVDVEVKDEVSFCKKQKGRVQSVSEKEYVVLTSGTKELAHRPVVIGSGPAGIFCTYLLAQQGYAPILLERGAPVEERTGDVEAFWNTGHFKPDSNVQFGEGGAGTFSDGKLNTLVKDPVGRNRFVLETFVKYGAPEAILYENKPHMGTDVLSSVIQNMRTKMLALGAQIQFHSQVTDICTVDSTDGKRRIKSVVINGSEVLEADVVIFAIGHSARDTFEMLHERGLSMTAKSFAVGLRVEHRQKMIDESQYGRTDRKELPAASYKLTAQLENGRGVYSFCMCPGGYVVDASSEEGYLAVNGMSYHDRAGKNANSAIIVTVTPEDFESTHPLAGVTYQRMLEKKAFQLGNGRIPVQCYGDFCAGRVTETFGNVIPQTKGACHMTNLRELFSPELSQSLEDGIRIFGKKIRGFDEKDTILSGVESRTSCPVKIPRDIRFESSVSGLYPCGEGAGFAGGITSAAMDGMKAAEAIISRYKRSDN